MCYISFALDQINKLVEWVAINDFAEGGRWQREVREIIYEPPQDSSAWVGRVKYLLCTLTYNASLYVVCEYNQTFHDSLTVVTIMKCFNFGISKADIIFQVSLAVLPLAPNLPHCDRELSIGIRGNFALSFIAGCSFLSFSICLFLGVPKHYPAMSWCNASSIIQR